MTARWLATPWNRDAEGCSVPGSLLLKLRLGEAPDAVPTTFDVRAGIHPPATRTTLGAVDRVLSHFSDEALITRIHRSAASLRARHGGLHLGFDDREHALGLSRTFEIRVDRRCRIDHILDGLRRLHEVEWASPHFLVTTPFSLATLTPADLEFDEEQAWRPRMQVRGPAALAYEPGDPATIVGLADTGTTPGHVELQGRMRAGLDTVRLGGVDLAQGMRMLGDSVGIDTDPTDEVGHGTGCSAIIGAAGVRIPPGLAGECSVLPARVLGSAGFGVGGQGDRFGVGSMADIDAGMKWAIDLGARVMNLSFGTPENAIGANDPQPYADIVSYASSRGCVLVAAGGNSGKEELYTPASLDGVIAVGSVDGNDRPSSFSTRGAHVALSAPGEQVASAALHGYALLSGTSFAAPFVTAAAGLLVSRADRRSYPIAPDEVRTLLMTSARPFPTGTTDGHGAGVLDAHAALEALDRQIDRGPPEGRDFPS